MKTVDVTDFQMVDKRVMPTVSLLVAMMVDRSVDTMAAVRVD